MTKRHGGEIALWTWAMVPTRLLERVPRKEGVWRAGECRPSISRLRSRQQPTALSTTPATHASADSALCRADIVASCRRERRTYRSSDGAGDAIRKQYHDFRSRANAPQSSSLAWLELSRMAGLFAELNEFAAEK